MSGDFRDNQPPHRELNRADTPDKFSGIFSFMLYLPGKNRVNISIPVSINITNLLLEQSKS
jgi:hypothetical protein